MKLILDTYVLLWLITGSGKVSSIVELVKNRNNIVYYSAASLWEIAIKFTLGKLNISPEEAIAEFKAAEFDELPICEAHVIGLGKLPVIKEHKDPFDRTLVAQAVCEGAKLISADSKLGYYRNMVGIIEVKS